jgi:membrane protein involved in colicin uptake
MGEKQVRTEAEHAGAEALRPRFDALGDLAIAAEEARKVPELLADAQRQSDQILADAEEAGRRRMDTWRAKWKAAKDAGWAEEELQGPTINQERPPGLRGRKPRAQAASGKADVDEAHPEVPQQRVGE